MPLGNPVQKNNTPICIDNDYPEIQSIQRVTGALERMHLLPQRKRAHEMLARLAEKELNLAIVGTQTRTAHRGKIDLRARTSLDQEVQCVPRADRARVFLIENIARDEFIVEMKRI